jgi:hypothetical protein
VYGIGDWGRRWKLYVQTRQIGSLPVNLKNPSVATKLLLVSAL